MSTSSISSSMHSQWQQFQQEVQKLGQDLASGDLSAAQADLVTLRSESQFSQLFDQLGRDMESGDLPGAQSDFFLLQQLLENNSSPER